MLKKLADFFKEPPVKETIQDADEVKKMYSHWRLRIFLCMFYRIYDILSMQKKYCSSTAGFERRIRLF